MKQLFIIFFFLLFFNVSAQQNFTGCVVDVGTNLSVPKMGVMAKPSGGFTHSDEKGQFSISFLSVQDLTDVDVYIANNVVHWKSENFHMMWIYDLQSALVYQKDIRDLKYSQIPRLPSAYYLLCLSNDHKSSNFLIYSNGEKILKRGKTKLNSFSKTPDTALFFRNEIIFLLRNLFQISKMEILFMY